MDGSEGRATGRPRRKHLGSGAEQLASANTPEVMSRDWLGRSLKQLFDGIAKEPIPKRILDKLEELERKVD